MAVPLLAPGYLETVKQLKAQAAENARQRKAQQDANTQALAGDFGKLAFNTISDFGSTAFKNSLDEPLELAKIGAYAAPEYDPPVMGGAANAGTNVLQPDVRSKALDALKAKVSPTAEVRPVTYEMGTPEKAQVKRDNAAALKPPAPSGDSGGPEVDFSKQPLPTDGTEEPLKSNKLNELLQSTEPPKAKEYPEAFKPPGPTDTAAPPQPKTPAYEMPDVPDSPMLGMFQPGFVPEVERADAPPILDFQKVARMRAGITDPKLTAAILNEMGQPTNRQYNLDSLSDKERGLFNASQSILAARGAETLQRQAAAQPKQMDAKEQAELQKINLETAKLKRAEEAAKAATVEGTPEYEQARLTHNDKVTQMAARTQASISGGGGQSRTGFGTGSASGSRSENLPRTVVIAVDDGHGWLTTVTAGGVRTLKSGAKQTVFYGYPSVQNPETGEWTRGPRTEYVPRYDKNAEAWTADPVNAPAPADKPGTAPSTATTPVPAAPTDVRPTRAPAAPKAPGVSPTPTIPAQTKPEKPATSAVPAQPAAAAKPDLNTASASELDAYAASLESQIPKGLWTPAQEAKYGPMLTESQTYRKEAKKAAQQEAAAQRPETQRAAVAARSALQKLDSTRAATIDAAVKAADDSPTNPFRPNAKLVNQPVYKHSNGALLTQGQLDAAKRGDPYVSWKPKASQTPEGEKLASDAYSAASSYYASARAKGASAFNLARKDALRNAIIAEVALHPRQVVSIKKFLEDQGVLDQFTPEERKAMLGELKPSNPNLQSKADDLFERINAQPWSAAKKRRVFLATAQRDGIA